MIPELGHFALILAFCVALVQGFLPLVGARSMFQETVLRVAGLPGAAEVVVVAGLAHRALIEAQLSEIGTTAAVLLEPEARDSAAAIDRRAEAGQ